jgi:hypothetical protein
MSLCLIATVGRMNPPTCGHERIIEIVKATAHQCDGTPLILVTKTHDKKNPLMLDDKVKHLRRAFPYSGLYTTDSWVKTLEVMSSYYDELLLVCGSDREAHYERIIAETLRKSWSYASVLPVRRDENDANPMMNISATKMRQFAQACDFDSFYRHLPTNLKKYEYAKELYEDVKSKLAL